MSLTTLIYQYQYSLYSHIVFLAYHPTRDILKGSVIFEHPELPVLALVVVLVLVILVLLVPHYLATWLSRNTGA